MKNLTKEELIEFEQEIEKEWSEGNIRAPVHFSKGNEDELIKIFENINENDWVFSTHRSHYHALLKGINPDWLKKEILEGRSIHLNNKENKFFTSAIVGGILPIALGTAMAIKLKNSNENVWVFVGDMCYDKETEILTDKGFKKFSELNKTELIAQINENNKIEFVKPLNYIKKEYNGKLIKFKSRLLNLVVTPEHRMYASKRKNNNYKIYPAYDLLKDEWSIKQACNGIKNPMVKKEISPSFLGIWIAEGSLGGKYKVYISQEKGKKRDKIKDMLKKEGFKFYEREHYFCFNSKELNNYLKQFGKSKDKFIPLWIKNSDEKTIKEFLFWYHFGDGNTSKGYKKYTTISRRLADDVQECLFKIGISSTVSKSLPSRTSYGKNIKYSIAERHKNFTEIRKINKGLIDYNGFVYCVNVPSGLIVVRRDNRIAICGNCAEMGIFHECVKYASRNNLPIHFVIEDNGLSVDTPTQKCWGEYNIDPNSKIIRYNYTRVYPHYGCGKFVIFK